MSEQRFISIQGVSKHFGAVAAVQEVDLEIGGGEFFSVLGPSGCGKTTLLRMLAGFETPTSGEIYIDGQALSAISAYRRPTNMVFQNYAIFPHLDVGKCGLPVVKSLWRWRCRTAKRPWRATRHPINPSGQASTTKLWFCSSPADRHLPSRPTRPSGRSDQG